MAKYKDIGGSAVGFRSGAEEYTYPSPEGDLYYNSSNGQFEFVGLGVGAWSTGGNTNVGRSQAGGFGTLTAGAIAGGFQSPTYRSEVEEYDGTSWTAVNAIPRVQRHMGSCGTQTAGLISGGGIKNPNNTYAESFHYDGTNWTEGGDMNVAKYNLENAGTHTAAISIAGQTGAPDNNTAVGTVEVYDGSSWTEVADLSSSRRGVGAIGTSTAAISAAGFTPPSAYSTNVELWNGSSWSEVAEMNTSRAQSSVAGTSTAGLMCGGETDDAQALTEAWDGTAWTEVGDLSTGRSIVSGANAGPSSATWLQGGYISGQSPNAYTTVLTEEWEFVHAIKTVTTS